MQVAMGKVKPKNTSGAPWPMRLKLTMGIHTYWRQDAPVPFHRQGNRGIQGDTGTWTTELWYVILQQMSITQSSACQGVPSCWWQSLVTTGTCGSWETMRHINLGRWLTWLAEKNPFFPPSLQQGGHTTRYARIPARHSIKTAHLGETQHRLKES